MPIMILRGSGRVGFPGFGSGPLQDEFADAARAGKRAPEQRAPKGEIDWKFSQLVKEAV